MQNESVLPLYRRQPHWSIPAIAIAFFAAVATLLILASQFIGWVLMAFAFCLTLILKRDRSAEHNCLRLTADGMAMNLPFRAYFASWSEVGEFGVTRLGPRKHIVFELSQSYIDRQGASVRWLVGMFGRKGSIPAVRGYTHEELASILNGWRSRHTINR